MEEDQVRGHGPDGEQVSHEGVTRLRAMLGSARVAMLTTIDETGALRSRPMAVQELSDEGDAWLITQATSPKVDDFTHARSVNLAWMRPVRGRYLAASGRAYLVRDPDKLKKLWHPSLLAWFPEGLDDPDLALIRVHLDTVECWDVPLGNFGQVARMAGSILGRPSRPREDGRQTILIRTRRPGIGDTAGIFGTAGGNLGVAPRAPSATTGPRVKGSAGGTMGEAPTTPKPRTRAKAEEAPTIKEAPRPAAGQPAPKRGRSR